MSRKTPIEYVDFDIEDLQRRLSNSPLSDEDKMVFKAVLDTFALLGRELKAKRISIARLRRLIFGASTEKLSSLESKEPSADNGRDDDRVAGVDAAPDGSGDNVTAPPERKRKGHGRHGAADYPGAVQRDVPHPSLQHGDSCPACCQGHVYDVAPMRLVRLHGNAPITAECTNLGQLRCGLCGEVFAADVPEDVKDEKYDEAVMAILALLKYGTGMPFHRLARLQLYAGVPLPAATQWQLCEKTGRLVLPVFLELVHRAAQGGVLYVDDTKAKILGLVRRHGESPEDARQRAELLRSQEQQLPVPPARPEARTGTFTSGIVSEVDGHTIVLYLTGWQHAGDNLEYVLSKRSSELPLPIQMCDALSRNASGEFQTILANCLAHARREFVDLTADFEQSCLHVIRQLAKIYHHDNEARRRSLSPEQRLAWHQEHSAPVMSALDKWMKTEVTERRVEPNSSLGSAFRYMSRHWAKLTRFLHVAGAPLDNNACERILKRAILHRRNSLFFRSARGARVADICMTLIQTAELSKKDPLHYLTTLLTHHQHVATSPEQWLPWNYEQTLEGLHSQAA